MIAGALVGGLAALGLTACGGGSSSANGAGSGGALSPSLLKELHTKKITITVADWGDDGQGKTVAEYNAEKAAFQKEYPNITIKPTTLTWYNSSNVGEAWYTAMEAGNIPSVAELPFTEPSHMIGDGYAANIAPELKLLGWEKYMNPKITKILQRGSAVYGLPESDYYEGLLVNPVLFKEAGLWNASKGIPNYPKTWPQLRTDAIKIQSKVHGSIGLLLNVSNTGGGFDELNILRAYGCEPETEKGGKWLATYDTAKCTQALDYIKSLRFPTDVLEPNYLATGTVTTQQMVAGEVAMTIDPVGSLDSLQSTNHMSTKYMSMWPIPAAPDGVRNAVLGGVYGSFSPKDSPLQILAGLAWIESSQALNPLGGKAVIQSAKALRAQALKEYPKVMLGIGAGADLNTTEYASDAPVLKELASINTPKNVNMKFFSQYLKFPTWAQPEPPEDTQSWYTAMSDLTQKMWASASSNPAALAKASAQQFQNSYLDSGS